MTTTFMQLIFSEFDGSNYQELATKYRTPVRKIYRLIRLAAQNAMRQALLANAETRLEVLWCDQTERLDNLRSCAALLQAAQTALNSHRPDLSGIALVALPLKPPAMLPGSNLGATSVAPTEIQQGTPSQTYSCLGSASLSPFSKLLARLVELVGAENAAQTVREFAGKTIQFPITDHYGFPADAPILGEKRHKPLSEAEAKAITEKLQPSHYGELVKRVVSPRMTIHFEGTVYDVSHLPNAAVGEVITVSLANLKPIKQDDFGFSVGAPVIGERLAELRAACTRRNGKVLLNDQQLEALLRSQATGKAPCEPQASLASPQTPSVDWPLADQTQLQPCSTLQPNAPQPQGCSEQLHSPRHATRHTHRLPNRLRVLFLRVAAWFQRKSTE